MDERDVDDMIKASASAILLLATNLYVESISSKRGPRGLARSLVATEFTISYCDMRSLPREGTWSSLVMADNFFLIHQSVIDFVSKVLSTFDVMPYAAWHSSTIAVTCHTPRYFPLISATNFGCSIEEYSERDVTF
jgi:hypothetical protein